MCSFSSLAKCNSKLNMIGTVRSRFFVDTKVLGNFFTNLLNNLAFFASLFSWQFEFLGISASESIKFFIEVLISLVLMSF